MAGFWAGFGEEFSRRVREREAFAREKAEEQRRYLREQGLRRQQETQKLVNTVLSSASYLKNMGLEEDKVKFLVDRDPTAMDTLVTAIKDAAEEGRTISSDTLNAAVNILPDYVAPEESLSDFVNSRFAAFTKSTASAKPNTRKDSLLAAIMGYDDNTIDSVYSEPLFGEFTGADVAASIGAPMLDVSTAGTARLDLSGMIEPDEVSISAISAAASDLKGMIKDIQDQTLSALRRAEASPEEIMRAAEQPWTIPAVRDQVDRYVALFDDRIYDILGPNYRPVEEEEGGTETPVGVPTPSANPDDYRYFASEAAAEEFARRSPDAWRRMPYVNIGGQVVQNTDYTGM